MKTLTLLLSSLVLLVAAALAFSYSGLVDVSARAKDPAWIAWLLENTREEAIRTRAGKIQAPALGGERWRAGAKAFDDMCSRCHGAPGKEPFPGSQDMNPPPPDLSEIVPRRSPAELFWVIENGIRMTGMPAWGPTHTEPQIWDLVAFLRRLPQFSVREYQEALRTGKGHSHAGGHGHSPEDSDAHQTEPHTHGPGEEHEHHQASTRFLDTLAEAGPLT